MNINSRLIAAITALPLTGLAAGAVSMHDEYSLRVPNGLAFSEFSGYEGWQLISVSHNGGRYAAILGNPKMIAAFRAGVPGNGKPFPDGRQDGQTPLGSEDAGT